LVRRERGPIADGNGIDKNQTGDFFGIKRSVVAHDEAAEGVTNQNVRWGNAGLPKQSAKLRDKVIESARRPGGCAPSQPSAVVATDAGEIGYTVVHRLPTERGAGDARFQDDTRAMVAGTLYMQPVQDSAGRGIAAPVAPLAKPLVGEGGGKDEQDDEQDDEKHLGLPAMIKREIDGWRRVAERANESGHLAAMMSSVIHHVKDDLPEGLLPLPAL
jgi:hypothetical protein